MNTHPKERLLAFIPLRAGSKGIPQKNKKIFGGKPLFQWIVDTVLATNLFDEIWIATDDSDIVSLTKEKYGNRVHIFIRSSENARDTSPTIDVVLEFIDSYYSNREYPDDKLILLQATSPLTAYDDIVKGVDLFCDAQYDSIVSCYRMKKFRWENGKPLDYDLYKKKPRRQEYDGFLVEAGAFYGAKISALRNSKQILSGKVGLIEVGHSAMIDIDEPIDWLLGETFQNYIHHSDHK